MFLQQSNAKTVTAQFSGQKNCLYEGNVPVGTFWGLCLFLFNFFINLTDVLFSIFYCLYAK